MYVVVMCNNIILEDMLDTYVKYIQYNTILTIPYNTFQIYSFSIINNTVLFDMNTSEYC